MQPQPRTEPRHDFPLVADGCRVLVVDDDSQHIRLFSIFLELSGAPVAGFAAASTTDQAVKAIGDLAPDIVFLDNRMPPHADFRYALEALRVAGYAGPVIVHSSSIDEPIFEDISRFGVVSVIDKREIRARNLKELLNRYL